MAFYKAVKCSDLSPFLTLSAFNSYPILQIITTIKNHLSIHPKPRIIMKFAITGKLHTFQSLTQRSHLSNYLFRSPFPPRSCQRHPFRSNHQGKCMRHPVRLLVLQVLPPPLGLHLRRQRQVCPPRMEPRLREELLVQVRCQVENQVRIGDGYRWRWWKDEHRRLIGLCLARYECFGQDVPSRSRMADIRSQ
jgi:hypothetical protein